jgi:RNA polymerase sigma-70 factor (ECF subfamily)
MPAAEVLLDVMDDRAAIDEGPTDAALLDGYFSRGDQASMERFFQRHADSAYRIALAVLGNSADADEAVQTVFIQILQTRHYRSIANIRGWVMGMVVNTCRMKVREETRRRARQEAAGMRQTDTTEPDSEKDELIEAAKRMVQGLPEHYRLPVWMHFLEGFPSRTSPAPCRCPKAPSASKRGAASSRCGSRWLPPATPPA